MNDKNYLCTLKIVFGLFVGMSLFSCKIQKKIQIENDKNSLHAQHQKNVLKETKKTYIGWWIYGEDQHIFKDQSTLEEYDLEFLNENIKELNDLYLAVCEMEYFPMECQMTGYIVRDIVTGGKRLMVVDFEILYIQGCDE